MRKKFSTGKTRCGATGFLFYPLQKVRKKREVFLKIPWYYGIAEKSKGVMCKETMKKVNPKRVVDELAAIGFARATDFLAVEDGTLVIRSTDELSKTDKAAIASVESTSNGIRLKLYDKMKALELLGKYMGIFDGDGAQTDRENNLLEAILEATQEAVDTHDIPELQ